jgi:IMP dehydrogenase
VVVDVAHGHAEHVLEMVRQLKERFPGTPVIAGNVATAQGVQDLAVAGQTRSRSASAPARSASLAS